MRKKGISVVISTYNSERYLELVLWGFQNQTFKEFEIVIADDGSGPQTKACIDRISSLVDFPIQHIWQEDKGFQKSRILNKALLAANYEYIVMTDGDCIPREDFLAVHDQYKKRGCFLSGGYVMLPMNTSMAINEQTIQDQSCFNIKWLMAEGYPSSKKRLKLTLRGWKAQLMNKTTPTRASWNGHNASGWLRDLLDVNGFDERMQYGGQDRELGERLVNAGIRPIQIRYSAICVHLDHKRGYKTPESIAKNKRIRAQTKKERLTRTTHGIQKVI
ncbi:MAG: glycosyl transferase family 2 [Flavobacteriaceae bacterium]|nr:glycosyl transferase family 2 [Flavobacteriaceae bacterium]